MFQQSMAIFIIIRMLMNNTPAITSALVIGQTILYYHTNFSVDYALIPNSVVNDYQFSRIITGAFLHAGELHLYFNMIALSLRGKQIEEVFGPEKYLAYIAELAVLSNLMYVFISYLCSCANIMPWLFYQPVVGFSGVIFGLKTMHGHLLAPERQVFLGTVVETKYIVLIELALASLLNPNASFLGHLCGIVSGYALSTAL
jgi:membrane associated rhomboid family serine protease